MPDPNPKQEAKIDEGIYLHRPSSPDRRKMFQDKIIANDEFEKHKSIFGRGEYYPYSDFIGYHGMNKKRLQGLQKGKKDVIGENTKVFIAIIISHTDYQGGK
jgi:hypothetical protein